MQMTMKIRSFIIAVTLLLGAGSPAWSGETLRTFARWAGFGWSDGYHTCRNGNCGTTCGRCGRAATTAFERTARVPTATPAAGCSRCANRAKSPDGKSTSPIIAVDQPTEATAADHYWSLSEVFATPGVTATLSAADATTSKVIDVETADVSAFPEAPLPH